MIGPARCGLLETVLDGETGFLVDGFDPGPYARAVQRLGGLPPERVRAHSARFSADRFAQRMTRWISDVAD